MAHNEGSFSYRVVNKKIRDILDARSELDNTTQVAMPFIKATTTLDLGGDRIGFTLGLHAINEDVKHENIYSNSENGDMPLLGYTYTKDGTNERVYADDPNSSIMARAFTRTFDLRSNLFTNTNVIKTPPPGITKVTVGRNKNGILAHGQLEITVPSLIQLEALHQKFLVPGVGMVLEWGQQFAPELSPHIGELSNISDALFPWHDRAKLNKILTEGLALNKIGLEEILEDYAYKADGQYMWMFGRIANFSTKLNSDGSYNCTVKIVGPSEDSWAYATKNTVTPAKDDSSKYFCASTTNSVYSYFTETTTGAVNFKTLLDNVHNGSGELKDWKDHVQYFSNGNKQAGEPTETEKNPNVTQEANGTSQDAYFITWRFFVNVVLNNENWGVKSIFKSAIQSDQLKKLGILLPYAVGANRSDTNVAKYGYINDEFESYVGMNKFLRSVNPGTMLIINETAAAFAEGDSQYNLPSSGQKFHEKNAQTRLFYDGNVTGGKSLFDQSVSADDDAKGKLDRGFLSSGVWLNHNAVVESMMESSTILRGITNLLERMNAATLNYWNLTLDVAHPKKTSDHSYNYMVVDANFKESSENAVTNFINDVHLFNKHARVNEVGKLIGSELIDCTIDLSLPKLMFSQIATMGLVQSSDIENVASVGKTERELAIDATVAERRAAEAIKNGQPPKDIKSSKISEPFDPLREMFAILSLSGINKETKRYDSAVQGPDLTILPKDKRDELLKANGVCGKANVQTTAGTAGNANRPAGTVATDIPTPVSKDINYEETRKLATGFINNPANGCAKCPKPTITTVYGSARNVAGNDIFKDFRTMVQDMQNYRTFAQDLVKTRPDKPNEFKVTENSLLYSLQDKLSVTNTNGHMEKSAHYTNQAIDIPVYDSANAARIVEFWTRTASPGYQVIDEHAISKNHIHIEWNAKIEDIPSAFLTQQPATKPPAELTEDEKKKCIECGKQELLLAQTTIQLSEAQKTLDDKIRQFPGLNSLFRYIEVFPDYMVANMTNEANGVDANAFGASPAALSISADLTMPGISGLRVGELFWIDRIPSFYKVFGAFQIISIEDNIGIDGWTTKIHATFNYLGKTWKEVMNKKIEENRQ